MKKLLFFVILLAAIAGGVFWMLPQLTRPQVTVAAVTTGTAVDSVSGNVIVRSALEISLRATEPGTIVYSAFSPEVGALKVAKGDLLFRIDPRLVELSIEEVESQIADANAQFELGLTSETEYQNAREDLERNQALAGIGQFPKAELERQVRNLASLKRAWEQEKLEHESSLKQYALELRRLQLRLEALTIRAPIDGVMVEASAFRGDEVSKGEALGRIVSDARIIAASVTEEDFPGIAIGQAARLRFLGFEDQLFDATVSAIAPGSDPESKRREIFVTLDGTLPFELASGMTGEAAITKAVRENALLVPRRALLGNFVYRVGADNTVEAVAVTPGFTGLRRAEILEGLEPGDRVIVENFQGVQGGQIVEVVRTASQ